MKLQFRWVFYQLWDAWLLESIIPFSIRRYSEIIKTSIRSLQFEGNCYVCKLEVVRLIVKTVMQQLDVKCIFIINAFFQVYCTILEWKRETFGTGVRMLINNVDEHFYEESHLTTKQTNQLFLH